MISKEEKENKIKPIGEMLQDKINRLSEENFRQSQYIAQLESEKQNLIEKLERDIKNNQISFNHIYNISTADIEKNAICNYAKEILKILKGENYDN